MEIIWSIMMFSSLCILLFSAPELVLNTMIESSKNAITNCLNLLAIYAVWLGILEIVEKAGLGEKLGNLFAPIIKKLFKIKDKKQIEYVSYNLSSNMLGLGNVATPSGIKAVKEMEKDLPKTKFAIFMLVVINCTSIQILPTTVVSLRSSAGSSSASDIILPSLFASTIATIVGILLLFLFNKSKKGKL